MSREEIEGFDYSTGQRVSRTRDEWRRTYPASTFRRRVENGETFYTPTPTSSADRPRIAAEAYANIPEARP